LFFAEPIAPNAMTQTITARGFSLPELAVVLAVTALIVGVGVSAYRTHVVRAEIASSIAIATHVQEQVALSFKHYGDPPANRESAGLSPAKIGDNGPYVDSIDVVDGRVDLHFGHTADVAIAGRTLSLTPFETADRDVIWICGNRVAGAGLYPLGFANGARQAVQIVTQIEPRYLPSGCR
jgi:prepilin-type N-terminal cleavage/methylation domain-containing protein